MWSVSWVLFNDIVRFGDTCWHLKFLWLANCADSSFCHSYCFETLKECNRIIFFWYTLFAVCLSLLVYVIIFYWDNVVNSISDYHGIEFFLPIVTFLVTVLSLIMYVVDKQSDCCLTFLKTTLAFECCASDDCDTCMLNKSQAFFQASLLSDNKMMLVITELLFCSHSWFGLKSELSVHVWKVALIVNNLTVNLIVKPYCTWIVLHGTSMHVEHGVESWTWHC